MLLDWLIMNELDIATCRNQRPYSRREYVARLIWLFVSPLFRWSPRQLFGWRRFLLRLFGAKVGERVHIYPTAIIYLPWKLAIDDEASIGEWALIYNLGMIVIGKQATVSHHAHLCAGTHDYHDPSFPLLRLPISVGPRVWVCAEAFVGPNVKIGESAIVSAGSVVVKDVFAWQIVGGNPAKFIKMRTIKEYSA